MTLQQRLTELVRACFTGIWIESHEHEDALAEIASLCREQSWRLANWDIDRGLSVAGARTDEDTGSGSDPLAAIRSLRGMEAAEGTSLLVLQNFHRFLQSAGLAFGAIPGQFRRSANPLGRARHRFGLA